MWCCGNGELIHSPWQPGSAVRRLYMTPRLGQNSRMVNSLFCTAVLYSGDRNHGLTYQGRGHGPPALRVSGQMYARFIRPPQTCWFIHDSTFDSSTWNSLPPQFQQFVREFADVLRRSANPFANIDGLPSESSNVAQGNVTLCVDGEHDTLYALFLGHGSVPPTRTAFSVGSGQTISEASPLWELMLYPLFHPVPQLHCVWSQGARSTSGRTLTLLRYLRSVMLREPYYWRLFRLAHQHVLDMWSRNEQQAARVWKSPAIQSRIRAFIQRTNGSAALYADKVYLPASVPGSFRYQQRFFHDAIYIASRMGNPHLFITMTANPQWPEVRQLLRPGEAASSRLDAIARAFSARRHDLLTLLQTRDFLFPGHLGVDYIIYVTEWQLCGLPHMHLACRLKLNVPMFSVQQQISVMDACISAQYPRERGLDYDFVESYMTHNNPCRACLRPNRRTQIQECRFRFPKPVAEHSYVDAKGFPVYRRTASDIFIVPHNVKILRRLGCHANVEWTFACGCIAYLYKYMAKGYDAAGIRISEYTDEVAAFRRVRVITGGEAAYRALGYDLNYRRPAVVLCKFGLPLPPGTDRAASRYVDGDPDDMHAEIAQELGEI